MRMNELLAVQQSSFEITFYSYVDLNTDRQAVAVLITLDKAIT